MSINPQEAAEAIREQAETMSQRAEHFRFRGALVVAIIAGLLAIATLLGRNADQLELNENIDAADFRTTLDLKISELASLQVAIRNLERQLADPATPAVSRPGLQRQLETEQAGADVLRSNPSSGDGIKELTARVQRDEQVEKQAGSAGTNYDYAEVLLQTAIILASVAILTVRRFILVLSIVLAVVAVCFVVNGFLRAVAL